MSLSPEDIMSMLMPPMSEPRGIDEVEAELNPKLDGVVGTLVEAIDEGGRELAGTSLAMAILALTPGEIIDLALMACLRLAENEVEARDAAE